MKITFLGTGASPGVPVLGCQCAVCQSKDPRDKRLRASIFIETNKEKILIDPGPDFRQQYLHYHLPGIDSFLITHPHHDHIGGLDDTRPVYYAMDKIPLQFYAEDFTVQAVRKYFDYLFPANGQTDYHGAPQSEFHVIEANRKFTTHKGTEIVPLRAFHGNMPVTAFKIDNLFYLTDVKTVPPETASQINDQTVLILGALHRQPHPLHFNLEEALDFIEKTRPAKTYLTHMSHWMGLHEETQKSLPNNAYLAYDGLVLEI